MGRSRIVPKALVTVLCVGASGAVSGLSQPGGMPVAVAPVVERELPATLRLVGTATANRSSVVAAEVTGVVARFETEEGDFLKKGALVCAIDPAVARFRADEARARLAALQAEWDELKNGVRAEELRRWQAAADEAEATLAKWQFERQRITALDESGRSSPKERHDAEMEYLAAAGRLAQIRAQLDQAKNGARVEELAAAKAGVDGAAAVLKRLERDLEKTEIHAPFDGFVVAKRSEVGEWIAEGGPVCEMIDVETVRIRCDAPASAVRFAQRGAPASVEIEALGVSRAATVARIIPRAAAAARTFPVEIELENADHAILPGMFTWAHVPAGEVTTRQLIHRDAIVNRGGSKTIFVVRPGAEGAPMAMPLSVETGLEFGGEIEVRATGLRAGDLVVCRANERLYGPTPVTPMPLTAWAEPTTRPAEH